MNSPNWALEVSKLESELFDCELTNSGRFVLEMAFGNFREVRAGSVVANLPGEVESLVKLFKSDLAPAWSKLDLDRRVKLFGTLMGAIATYVKAERVPIRATLREEQRLLELRIKYETAAQAGDFDSVDLRNRLQEVEQLLKHHGKVWRRGGGTIFSDHAHLLEQIYVYLIPYLPELELERHTISPFDTSLIHYKSKPKKNESQSKFSIERFLVNAFYIHGLVLREDTLRHRLRYLNLTETRRLVESCLARFG